jgi:hypothetical protein
MSNKINDNLFFGYTSGIFINSFSPNLIKARILHGDHFMQYEKDFNDHSYRCDNFKKKHDGLHVLFSGCSVTFGDGLEKDETWSWNVYEEIKKTSRVSGYFNLAHPGSSISANIIRLFKYFSEFGNPDILFFNMPDVERFLSVGFNNSSTSIDVGDSLLAHQIGLKEDSPGYVEVSKESLFFGQSMTFELYSMLEAYCKAAGIRLISFSWTKARPSIFDKDRKTTYTMLKDFETYHNLDDSYELPRYIHKYIEANLNGVDIESSDVPYLIARDGDHPGIIQNKFFADTALKILDGSNYRWIEE